MIYHIAKFNCFKSSRLQMQSAWDFEFIYIHISDKNNKLSKKLSFKGLKGVIKESSNNDVFVFHAQSSLVYLIIGFIFLGLTKDKIVYDIHDLNIISKKFNYLTLRGTVFFILEFLVLKLFKIKSCTVSSGIAHILKKRYYLSEISVVRNVSSEFFMHNSNSNKPLKKGVYFGAFDRLNQEFFTTLERNDLKIHLYGRFNTSNESTLINYALSAGLADYKGEYDPRDLSFLKEYDYLYYNISPLDLNYVYAGPNKFFQALSYGLVLLTPGGYKEMEELLQHIPGPLITMEYNLKNQLEELRCLDFVTLEKLASLVKQLKDKSELDYKKLTAKP